MTVINAKETSEEITMKNPHTGETIETYNGKQIGDKAFVTFQNYGSHWAWTLVEVDSEIKDGVSTPHGGKSVVVDPNGFIYKDEIYKIEGTKW